MSASGKVAIVTGGSRGIGRAACIRLAGQGAKVVVCDYGNDSAPESVVAEIAAAGGDAVAIRADVRSAAQANELAAAVLDAYGRIDVLVCNAVADVEAATFEELSWTQFERQMTEELKAAFEPTKAVIPAMKAQRFGRIVYLSSTEGKDPTPRYVAFGTAKGGLDSFARYIAQEFGPYGISSNVVAPGFVRGEAPWRMSEDECLVVGGFTPLGRIAEPEDVAGVIAFLAGDDARFLTGTYTPVTGGLAME